MSIRARLLWLVLSVLLPAIVAGGWLIDRSHRAERAALERELQATTEAMTMAVERELLQRTAIANVLSGSLQAQVVDDRQLAALDQQARYALEDLGGWVQVVSSDTALVDTRLPLGKPQPRTSREPLTDAAALTALDAVGGELHAAVILPVQRNGRTLLNITVAVLPEVLQKAVDLQALPEGWEGTVIDNRGAVVTRRPAGSLITGSTVPAPLQRLLSEQRQGLVDTVASDGTPLAGYISTTPRGWRVLTASPQPQLAAALPPGVVQLAGGAALLLAAAAISALWVSRSIAAPAEVLQRQARLLQSGEPVARIATGVREFDAAVDALADAADAVRHVRTRLEGQVAGAVAQARTAEQQAARGQRAEALGRLTSGVAHDFNNLLGVISNSAHLMQRHPAAAAELRAPLGAVLRSVESGSRLTQNLMRVAGSQPSRRTQLQLQQALPEILELMQMVLGKRVQASLNVDPGTRRITVDASELELALINLALNARDAFRGTGGSGGLASGKRGGQVWLQAHDAGPDDTDGLPPGSYVVISVSDDGAGFGPDVADRAFQPFFSTKPAGQGSGLGLAQVQNFCTQAGGRARLDSTPGVGTSVLLVLPAAAAARATADAAGPAAGGSPEVIGDEQRLQGARVLVVEDNDELAGVTAGLLSSYGCIVELAREPAAALRLVESGQRFDVVLSDVVMPGPMDGLALAAALRQQHPALPVVLISGYSSALGGTTGFTVLHKPCTPQQMTAALADAMAAPPGRPPTASNGTTSAPAPGGA